MPRRIIAATFKPLVSDHEPIAIPEDCFYGVATFLDEEEQVATQRILFRMSTGSVQRNSLVRDGRLSMPAPPSRQCRLISPQWPSRESGQPRSPHLPTAHHTDLRPRGSRRRLAAQSAERCGWGRVPQKALLHCLSHRRPVPKRQETAESPAETSSPPQSA
ncbi:MAG: hypothetical protein RLZZ536_3489 [Planctomycetota bacterium]|jgi:hypothetical protein